MLTPEDTQSLQAALREMRHEVRNHLSVLKSSLDVIRHRPEKRDNMLAIMSPRIVQIEAAVQTFSAELDKLAEVDRQDARPRP